MHHLATMLMRSLGRAARALPAVRGRGRLAIALTSRLLKAGADPIVECKMAAGHRLRLDCRVPSHSWAFFSGKYDDEKWSALLSFLRPGGAALDVGANIGFYTTPMAAFAQSIGARVVAVEPVAVNAQWLRYNLALNACAHVVDVFEVGLADECGKAEIVLADDFLAGGMVGNATIAVRGLYGPQFSRAMVRIETLDRIWAGKSRLDAAKVDIEGYEAKFLQGGRATIASHRPVILMEASRWHHEQRGIDFDTVIPSLLPNRYTFAEFRSGGIAHIGNIAQCTGTDVLAIPEERLHEIDRRQRLV
jgi:FkbM family methyltransferase